MSKYQDDSRKIEVQMIINIIESTCIKNNISLVPYRLKNGIYVTSVYDHLEDVNYVITKEKGANEQ